MTRKEAVLTRCIEAVRSGEATVEESLRQCQGHGRELEPLLKLGANIEPLKPVGMEPAYKRIAKARLLEEIQTAGQAEHRQPAGGPLVSMFNIFKQPALCRVAVSFLAVILLFASLAGGTAYAARSSLPGEMLYPAKTGTESLRLFIAGGNLAKAELSLDFAMTRLLELDELESGAATEVGLALEGYRNNLDAFIRYATGISGSADFYSLAESAPDHFRSQIEYMDQITDSDPGYAQQIGPATTAGLNAHIEFMDILAQYDLLSAAQINLDAMQGRLERASDMADRQNYPAMQAALLQYQQLNRFARDLILKVQAGDSQKSEIESLNLQAALQFQNILDDMAQQAAEEHRNSIEASRQATSQLQEQISAGDGNSNQPGEGSGSPDARNDNGQNPQQDGQAKPQTPGGTGTTDNGSGSGSADNPASGADNQKPPDGGSGSTGAEGGNDNNSTPPAAGGTADNPPGKNDEAGPGEPPGNTGTGYDGSPLEGPALPKAEDNPVTAKMTAVAFRR